MARPEAAGHAARQTSPRSIVPWETIARRSGRRHPTDRHRDRAMPRRLRPLPATLLLAALLPACEPSTGPGSGKTPEPLKSLPRALTTGERQTIAASNDFAFELLRETSAAAAQPNVVVSPLSASMALGMTLNGARGATLEGMRSALGFGSRPLEEVDASYRTLIDLLRGVDEGVEIRIANSVWAKQGFPFEASFKSTVARYFDAEVATVDFAAPATLGTINGWVKRGTNGRIDSILESIPPEAVMYLINAVYFKGAWRERFDPKATRDAPFTAADGSTRTVKMMHRVGAGRFFQAPGVRGVELAYGRDAFVMDVVLPDAGTSLRSLVSRLDAATWDGWLKGARDAELDLSLPRFRAEQSLDLKRPLMTLGMGLAFTPDAADFTGLSPLGRELYVSAVKQKTFVDVNEEGTEAAAATSVEIGVTSAPVTVPFVVDRPFLLAIRERLSGAILFLGAVGAP
jgi:serpin B